MKIGSQIAQLRKERNITQEQLAEALGISTQAISKWETGVSCPDISLLEPIAQFFHVSIDYLLDFQLKQTTDEIWEVVKESKRLCDNERHKEAIELVQNSLRTMPNNYMLRYQLGDIYSTYALYLSDGRDVEHSKTLYMLSIEVLEKVANDCPDKEILEDCLYTLCFSYIAIKQYDNALETLEKMPKAKYNVSNKLLEADILTEIGNSDKARTVLQRELYYSIGMVNSLCLKLRNVYFTNGQKEKSSKYLEFAIKMIKATLGPGEKHWSSTLHNDYTILALTYCKTGKLEEALDSLKQASEYAILSVTPDDKIDMFNMHDDLQTEAARPKDTYQHLAFLMENSRAFIELSEYPEYKKLLERLKQVGK